MEANSRLLYLEYEIRQNKPGLLGAVTTLIGLLDINIVAVMSIGERGRGLLLGIGAEEKANALETALRQVDTIEIKALRTPSPLDRLALKHGVRLDLVQEKPPTYCFVREEIGVLIDFLGDTLLEGGNQVIGLRGMPRVGKTEAAIAACVYANRKWILLSSTIIRQSVRTELLLHESESSILLIDGITSSSRGEDAHWRLLEQVFALPTPKIIEHPDIFLRDGRLPVEFDLMIEIRHHPTDQICLDGVPVGFSSFDLS